MPLSLKRFLALLGLLCLLAPTAWGHATLLATAPPANAVLDSAPQEITLTFNQPVGVTAMRLFAPDGQRVAVGPIADQDHAVRITLPATTMRGTYLLSWHVVSEDGHPVGGTLAYAVGAASANAAAAVGEPHVARDVLIWLARWLTYLCVFGAVGAALFRTLRPVEHTHWAQQLVPVGFVLLAIDLGLQGIDLRDVPLRDFLRPDVWSWAIASTYGWTVGLMALALVAAHATLQTQGKERIRSGAAVSLLLAGAAVAASGHAGTAPPQWLSRPLVAAHAILAIVWVGSLIPLARALKPRSDMELDDGPAALALFSRWIAIAVLLLIASGLGLALLQLVHVSDLWTTNYGRVLSAKLILVALLLLLAATNRWRHTKPALAGDAAMRRRLVRTTRIEAVVAIIILAVVSLWRLTPPPRSLEAAAPAAPALHFTLQDAKVRAVVQQDPATNRWTVTLTQAGSDQPFAAQGVTLALTNPQAGIEAIEAKAQQRAPGRWAATLPTLPPAGTWQAGLNVLVDDFDQITLGDTGDEEEHDHDHDAEGGNTAALEALQSLPTSKALTASGCWIRLLPPMIPSAAYLTVKNSGDTPQALEPDGASAAFESVMLHQTTEKNGVSHMSATGNLQVPAHGTLAFSPAGYHVMLEQPSADVKVGATVPIYLATEDGSQLRADCQVEPASTTRR